MSDLTFEKKLPDVVSGADNLPSLPTVVIEVLRLSADENSTLDDLAQVLGQDPALTAKLLKLSNSCIFEREGLNDGLVSVSSAQWGHFLGTLDADHSQQVGLQGLPGSKFDAKAFYRSVVRMLSDEGF